MKKAQLDLDVVLAAAEEDSNTGFCLACGAEADCVEPDARNYECEVCGEKQVFGAQEIILQFGAF